MSTQRARQATPPPRSKFLATKVSLSTAVILWLALLVAEAMKYERRITDLLCMAALTAVAVLVVAVQYDSQQNQRERVPARTPENDNMN